MSTRYGSDLIVDLLSEAGVDHVAFNPGASFRGIQDSLVHSDGAPSLVLCLHEALAVAVAQGYAKAAGKPMAVLLHDVVGLQNASMAIYNAWCDRAPMLLLGGTGPKSKAKRRPWIDWIHTANTQAEIVRNFIKWDDEPHDIASVPESFARALGATVSQPQGPVYLCYDVDLQEDELPQGFEAASLAGYAAAGDPAPAAADVERLVAELRSAERPAIVAGHAGGDEDAFARLGELAELLGAPVVDTGARLALGTDHALNASGVQAQLDSPDVVLALDVDNLRLALGGWADGARILQTGLGHLRLRGWSHDYQELVPAAVSATGSATQVVAALLGSLRADPPAAQSRAQAARDAIATAKEAAQRAAAGAEADGAVPLTRLVHELNTALHDVPFAITNGTTEPLDLAIWTLTKPRQGLGWAAGGGLGYGVGGAIGSALANGPGVVSVDLQADGDLLYLPSALWTAANLKLPVLVVVHDNRQYANTVGHASRIAKHRGRADDRRHVGAGLDQPATDLAALAAAYGVWSAGPITDPETLRARLDDAIGVVRGGRPALLDVVTPSL